MRTKIFLFVTIIFLFSAELALGQQPKEKKTAPAMPPAGVEAVPVSKRSIQSVIDLVGNVESPKTSSVSSEVEGLVKEVLVEEGDFVKKDAPLVTLKNSQLLIQLKNAKATLEKSTEKLRELIAGPRQKEIEEAKESMMEAKANLQIAERDMERNKELFEKKVIPERDYTNSKLQALAARSVYLKTKSAYDLLVEGTRVEQIAQQEAVVKENEAAVELIEDKIKKTTIKSPFTGTVVEKFVEKGEWIETGKEVVKLMQVNPLRIEVQVPEKVIPYVKPGNTVTVRFDVLKKKSTRGKVSSILPLADIASRTYPVRIRLDNPHNIYKAGMVARVSLYYGARKRVLMVPQDALTLFGNNKIIMVVTKENTAKMVPVKTGRKINGWIEVKGDVSEKDLVVIRGNERLIPGQPITILNRKKKG